MEPSAGTRRFTARPDSLLTVSARKRPICRKAGGAKGIAPEIHDLFVSKLVAGREKDISWAEAAVAHGLAAPLRVVPLLDQVDADKLLIERAKQRLNSLTRKLGVR